MMDYAGPKSYHSNWKPSTTQKIPQEESFETSAIFSKYSFNVPNAENLVETTIYPAISTDPFSGIPEYYLCVAQTSNLDGYGLVKQGGCAPLNLLLCFDTSYSTEIKFGSETRLETIQKTLLNCLLPQLRDQDWLSVISYSHTTNIIQPFTPLPDIKMGPLKQEILSQKPKGGSSVLSVLKKSYQIFTSELAPNDRSNILFIITDQVSGNTQKLQNLIQLHSQKHILIFFVGIGFNFDDGFMKTITGTCAVSWFTVETVAKFKEIMDQEFPYQVTQIYTSYRMNMEGGDFESERVYGSPGYEFPPKGVVLENGVSSPSTKKDDLTKGSVILVKLNKIGDTATEIKFPIEYITQSGKVVKEHKTLTFPKYSGSDIYEGPSRKAILLARLVNLTKWIIRDHRFSVKTKQPLTPSITLITGIKVPPPLTELQQQIDSDISLTLDQISPHYKKLLTLFLDYYKIETEVLLDPTLLQEIQLLEDLIGSIKTVPKKNPILPNSPQSKLNNSKNKPSVISHTPQYISKIEEQIRLLPPKEPLAQTSNTVEVCFVMDCTGSMGAYIKMCQEKINLIVDIIYKDNPTIQVNIAFVAYRDHNDLPGEIIPFGTPMDDLKNFIAGVEAEGGNDIPEDICGGLQTALNLNWTSQHRLLILIADAPCHGSMYHKEDDDYPNGDPKGLIPEVLLTQAFNKNIDIFFARIKDFTDQMTTLWQKHMRSVHGYPLNIFPITNENDFMANITDSITTVLMSNED